VSGALLGGLTAGPGGAIIGSGLGFVYNNIDKKGRKKK